MHDHMLLKIKRKKKKENVLVAKDYEFVKLIGKE